jgi:ABC-2 type transport system permease protein
MPPWLRAISGLNPLSYEVDGLRALMLRGGQSQSGLGLDYLVLGAVTLVLIVVATRMYPRLTQ